MLSYRHSFHAGNFADVIKHIVLIEILLHLGKKDSPFDYIDTHAGAGLFDLDSDHASKLQEYRDGVAKLNPGDWPELSDYFKILASFNPDAELKRYPGSPLIARALLRKKDREWLFELHPADFELLQESVHRDRQVVVAKEDGFTGLLRLLPPRSRRALVLIDPSYEIKDDYRRVVEVCQQACRKFPTGTYAIWYPVVNRMRVDELEQQFVHSGLRNIQRFELALCADSQARGLTASGMIVINPPWTLMLTMTALLPRLVKVLGKNEEAFYKADVLLRE